MSFNTISYTASLSFNTSYTGIVSFKKAKLYDQREVQHCEVIHVALVSTCSSYKDRTSLNKTTLHGQHKFSDTVSINKARLYG